MKRNNIVLIGFMGCGKTSVGMSFMPRYRFLDTDAMIEEMVQMSVNEIFVNKGEKYFRQCESRLISELSEENESFVLSTGGGMPLESENAEGLKRLGTVVYLKASAETIYERLKDDNTRPLLMCDDKIGRIRELLNVRDSKYAEAADCVVEVDNRSIEEICDIIEGCINENK